MARPTSPNQHALGGWPPSRTRAGQAQRLGEPSKLIAHHPGGGHQYQRLEGSLAQFVSHSPPFTTVHLRPRGRAGHGRSRPNVNGGAQCSKACEGATLPWVQIPPPPPLTCDDASPLCLLGGGGHRGGLSFGPQMVSVDRAEIPAAGCIGPELRPRTAADMIWEQTPAGPCRCR